MTADNGPRLPPRWAGVVLSSTSRASKLVNRPDGGDTAVRRVSLALQALKPSARCLADRCRKIHLLPLDVIRFCVIPVTSE